jgi:hypothetical protein
MNEERAKRKLSGILSADAVGYSRLMQEDEVSTIRLIREHNFLARQKFEEPLALDFNYAAAYNQLARTHFMDVWLGSSKSPKASLMTVVDLAPKAISLDDSLAESQFRIQ